MPRTKSGRTIQHSTIVVLKRACCNNLRELFKIHGPTIGSGFDVIKGKRVKTVGSGMLNMSLPTFYKGMRGDEVSSATADEIENLAVVLKLKNSKNVQLENAMTMGLVLKLVMLIDKMAKSFTPENYTNVINYTNYYRDHLVDLAPSILMKDIDSDLAIIKRQMKALQKENKNG